MPCSFCVVGTARISEHGLIGNCRTAALVNRFGDVVWGCFSRFDSPSAFGSILDPERGGHFSISPAGPFESSQSYRLDTALLQTRFASRDGNAACLTDCFAVHGDRPVLAPQHELLRILRGEKGELRFRLELALGAKFGTRRTAITSRRNLGIVCSQDRSVFFLRSDLPAAAFRVEDGVAKAELTVREGDVICFSLSYSDNAPAVFPILEKAAIERERETAIYWRRWLSRCSYRGQHPAEVRRSALTLKLLAFAPSGAIIAAPTTSLPEWLGAGRNWDYRFCWLRDAAFTVRALANLGYLEEARAYLDWLLHSTRLTHPALQVVYTVYGESRIRERVLEHLKGYRGSRPVRIGNKASDQFQLDTYGEVLDAAHTLLPLLGPVDRDTRRFLLGLGKKVLEVWNQPDDGIWEERSNRSHHTHSKVMAWAALDRLRSLAQHYNWKLPSEIGCQQERIREAIERRGFNLRLGYYTRRYDDEDLDASLLVMPMMGYLPAHAARFQATLRAIQNGLGRNGLIYRYRPGSDGMNSTEGAFLICSFWLAEAQARAGQTVEARRALDAVLGRMNGLGLLSEEMDPDTGEYLGNYPQGFSHVGLIQAALAIDQAQRKQEAA